jgi:uncharacterized HAD superfamily protein
MQKGAAKFLPEEVAFDIDGVVADTIRAFIKAARINYGIEIEYKEITEYEFWDVIDIDEKTCEEIIHRILKYPMTMGIRPMRGAVEVLTELSQRGPLLFVTARTEKDGIFEWVRQALSSVGSDSICLEATGSHEEKVPVLLQNNVKCFVDDRLETCYLLGETTINPVVFEQPWNQKPHPFRTVRNWEEIADMIEW